MESHTPVHIPWLIHYRNKVIRFLFRIGFWYTILRILPEILFFPFRVIFGYQPLSEYRPQPNWGEFIVLLIVMNFIVFKLFTGEYSWIETIYMRDLKEYCDEKFPVRNPNDTFGVNGDWLI